MTVIVQAGQGPVPVHVPTARAATVSGGQVTVVNQYGTAQGYSYRQATPAATWSITHGLARPTEPVILLDGEPSRQVWADLEHPSSGTTVITFPEPVAGWAHF